MKYLKFLGMMLIVVSLLASCGLIDNEYYNNEYYEYECYENEENCNDYYDENGEYNNEEDENNEVSDNENNEPQEDENDGGNNVNTDNGETIATMTSLEIQPVPASAPSAHSVFDKYVDVFGVSIYATKDLSEAKILHAAAIMAEYLDNDEDGVADNPRVIAAMQANDATLMMFASENSMENFIELLEESGGDPGQGYQPLFEFEIDMSGSGFDATLEEVLHLITQFGYAVAYPDVWGERRGSAVADAMDIARGGYFENVPGSYPAGAWYTYDDRTCEYVCMIAEYTYWSLTTVLGGQADPGRGAEIEHEWPYNTLEEFKNGDIAMYALLTNPVNGMPTRLPDGNYTP